MNDTHTNKRLTPTMAIVVYQEKGYSPRYFLEKRDIKTIGGKYTLLAPVPMADDTLKQISKVYVKTRSADMGFGGLIASHLLFAMNKPNKTLVVWYRPAVRRSLNFSASLKIKNANDVQIPALLFAVLNKTLYIFSVMESDRPNEKTKLYNAPFFNIYDDGNVCLGTARVGTKEKTFEKEADRFERAFFMAEQNGGTVAGRTKTPLAALWNQLIKSKKPFPVKNELIQHKKFKTLADLLQALIGKDKDEEVYDDED